MDSSNSKVEERELDVISSSLQPPLQSSSSRRSSGGSSSRKSLTFTANNGETCYLDVPNSAAPAANNAAADPETASGSGSRRCSTRMLSMNLQHTLRQLRKEEHNARVMALLKRNAIFYKRQRFCECVTMLSVLSLFTCFSLYIVFAHGFHFGKEKPFELLHNYTRKFIKNENEDVTVMCQADQHWEWCRWIHMDHYCDFEWVSSGSGVQQIGCDFPSGKVEFTGDYSKNECGLIIRDLDAKDRGIWMCEVEKYYTGFSRRYGEYRQGIVNLIVHVKPKTTTTSSPSSSSTATGNPTASALTPNSFAKNSPTASNINNNNNSTTMNPISVEEEYERQFFILRVIVLGTIGCVFSTLVLMFWIYFMYLWRTWDSGKREPSCMEATMDMETGERRASEGSGLDPYANEEDVNDDNETSSVGSSSDHAHPHFDRAIMRSRRKSVSFAVCKVNADTMQFDIEHKSVLLGNLSASGNGNSSSSSSANVAKRPAFSKPPASPLREVAKKWRDAKNKLVLKEKISNVFLGSSNLEELEFKDESFRNRRRELMEKAKALEEAAAKAKEAEAAEKKASSSMSSKANKKDDDETAI